MKLENTSSVSSNRVSVLSSFVVALLISGCSLCQEQKVSELESPNGKFVAALFMRDCGATETSERGQACDFAILWSQEISRLILARNITTNRNSRGSRLYFG